MNGYLVTAGTNLDDVPMGLFERREDARAAVLRVTQEAVDRVLEEVFNRDSSRLVCVQMTEFRNGVPVGNWG